MFDIRDHGGNYGGGKREFEIGDFGFSSIPNNRIIKLSQENISQLAYDNDTLYTISLNFGTYFLKKFVKDSSGKYVNVASVSLENTGTIALVGKYTPYVYLIINNRPSVYKKSDLSLVTDVIPSNFRAAFSSPVIAESSTGIIYLITMSGSFISATLKEFAVDQNGVMTFITDRSFGMAGISSPAITGFVHEDYIYLSTININSQRLFGRWNMRTNSGTIHSGTTSNYPVFNRDNAFVESEYLYAFSGGYTISKYLINSDGSLNLISSRTFHTQATGDTLVQNLFKFKKFIGAAVSIANGSYFQMYKIIKDTLTSSAPSNFVFYDPPYLNHQKEFSFLSNGGNGVNENYLNLIRR